MDETLTCWRCGAELDEVLLPLSRREECPACQVELHVCRMCVFYDTRVAKHCRETVADEVQDKTRANFCGYFQPHAGAYQPRGAEGAKARSELEALFGGTPESRMDTGAAADARQTAAGGEDPRAALERLFGGGS